MENKIFSFVLISLIIHPTNLQLLINVRNQGGDVMQENITANVSEDTVTLEFVRLDGAYITQLVDFTNKYFEATKEQYTAKLRTTTPSSSDVAEKEVEAMRIVIPGEEELGQHGHQTLCFLTHAAQADFIAPDAMAKLRQKNPGTVRVAEEDKGWRQTTATAWGGAAARRLSPAAARLCAGAAPHRVLLRAADLARWPPRPGLDQSSLAAAVTPFPPHALSSDAADGKPVVGACAFDTNPTKECICHLEVCVNWYPCGLKYCKGKPQGGLSYRCGIKTCRRCYRYQYFVRRRDACALYT